MSDVTTKDLLAKIGSLVVENDVLRARLVALEGVPTPAPQTGDDPAAALRPNEPWHP